MDILSILLGFVLGILFILLILIITVFLTNKKYLQHCRESFTVENDVIKKIISKKQKQIITNTKLGITNNLINLQNITKELIEEIASYYYPESKYPYLEISLAEVLDLNQKINDRLKQILDIKFISFLKNIRLAQIQLILNTKKSIENHKVYQLSKKYHLNKFLSYGFMALNITNPAYWIRKIIYTSTLETTLRSIAVMAINIIGEEASQLYSKKVIEKSDSLLEKELHKFIKEVEAS